MEDELTEYEVVYKDKLAVLSIVGKLTNKETELLIDKVKEVFESTHNIIFDLSRLTYISSSCLGVLISYNKKTREKEGLLVMSGITPRVKKILDIIGFTKIFDSEKQCTDTVEEALMKFE